MSITAKAAKQFLRAQEMKEGVKPAEIKIKGGALRISFDTQLVFSPKFSGERLPPVHVAHRASYAFDEVECAASMQKSPDISAFGLREGAIQISRKMHYFPFHFFNIPIKIPFTDIAWYRGARRFDSEDLPKDAGLQAVQISVQLTAKQLEKLDGELIWGLLNKIGSYSDLDERYSAKIALAPEKQGLFKRIILASVNKLCPWKWVQEKIISIMSLGLRRYFSKNHYGTLTAKQQVIPPRFMSVSWVKFLNIFVGIKKFFVNLFKAKEDKDMSASLLASGSESGSQHREEKQTSLATLNHISFSAPSEPDYCHDIYLYAPQKDSPAGVYLSYHAYSISSVEKWGDSSWREERIYCSLRREVSKGKYISQSFLLLPPIKLNRLAFDLCHYTNRLGNIKNLKIRKQAIESGIKEKLFFDEPIDWSPPDLNSEETKAEIKRLKGEFIRALFKPTAAELKDDFLHYQSELYPKVSEPTKLDFHFSNPNICRHIQQRAYFFMQSSECEVEEKFEVLNLYAPKLIFNALNELKCNYSNTMRWYSISLHEFDLFLKTYRGLLPLEQIDSMNTDIFTVSSFSFGKLGILARSFDKLYFLSDFGDSKNAEVMDAGAQICPYYKPPKSAFEHELNYFVRSFRRHLATLDLFVLNKIADMLLNTGDYNEDEQVLKSISKAKEEKIYTNCNGDNLNYSYENPVITGENPEITGLQPEAIEYQTLLLTDLEEGEIREKLLDSNFEATGNSAEKMMQFADAYTKIQSGWHALALKMRILLYLVAFQNDVLTDARRTELFHEALVLRPEKESDHYYYAVITMLGVLLEESDNEMLHELVLLGNPRDATQISVLGLLRQADGMKISEKVYHDLFMFVERLLSTKQLSDALQNTFLKQIFRDDALSGVELSETQYNYRKQWYENFYNKKEADVVTLKGGELHSNGFFSMSAQLVSADSTPNPGSELKR